MEKVIYYGNELYHYGIKGQKWGVRNYQNEDGSLTAEGRAHYGYGDAKSRVKSAKDAYKTIKKIGSKEEIQNAKAAYKSAKADAREAKRGWGIERKEMRNLTKESIAKYNKKHEKEINDANAVYERKKALYDKAYRDHADLRRASEDPNNYWKDVAKAAYDANMKRSTTELSKALSEVNKYKQGGQEYARNAVTKKYGKANYDQWQKENKAYATAAASLVGTGVLAAYMGSVFSLAKTVK